MDEKRPPVPLPLRLLAMALALCLAGCPTPKGSVTRPVELPKRFSRSGAAALPSKWWTAFKDPKLNALMDQALRGSFTLRSAWAKLDQARADARKKGADLWPTLDGAAGVANTTTQNKGEGRQQTTDFSLGLSASYEVDLWGRIRSELDAARLDARASEQDLHAAAMTLTADVAKTWYRLVEKRGQIRLLDEQIAVNQKALEIISHKYRLGQVSVTDVLQQRQLVERRRAARLLVESDAAAYRNKLATLVGRAPGRVKAPAGSRMPKLPPEPKAGIPAEWLRRRPDVRSAEIAVESADRSVAAAIADRFPTLTLSAGASTSGDKIQKVFDNWAASLAAGVVAPILDGGSRRAEEDKKRGELAEKLNDYAQTLLDSFREVEDALVREAKQTAYVASFDRRLKLSAQASEQTRRKYVSGGDTFTRYLDALLSLQELQRSRLEADLKLVEYRIDLYRALGGAWDLSRPERTKFVWETTPPQSATPARPPKSPQPRPGDSS